MNIENNNDELLNINYSSYLSRMSNADLQLSRTKIYDLLFILHPVYELAKNSSNELRFFINEIESKYDLDSELIYTLNTFTQAIPTAQDPEIPPEELDIIKEPVTELLEKYNTYIELEYNRSASAYNIINAKNIFYDKLFNFVVIINEKTEFLKGIYDNITQVQPSTPTNNTRRLNILAQVPLNNALYVNTNANRNIQMNTNVNINRVQQQYMEKFNKMNKSKLFNTLNTNGSQLNRNTSSPTSALNTSKCVDATMYTENTIDPSSTKLYIADQNNKIVRVYCLDDDAFNGYFKGTENIVYECEDYVPNSSFNIRNTDIIHIPYRRLAFEFNVYIHESQAKKIEKGGSYILKNTMEPLGRLASHYVVLGGPLESALHCQPDLGGNYIYSVKNYNPSTGGYKKKSHKTHKNIKKYRNKKQTRVRKSMNSKK